MVRSRLLFSVLLLSACGQAQEDEVSEVSEVNGGSAGDTFPRAPAAMASESSDAETSGSAAMATPPSLDSGTVSSSMAYDAIAGWEEGVPAELAADASRCVFVDAFSSATSCQLAIECDPEHNPGRLMSTCSEAESGQYLCACTWVGKNYSSRIFFESDPYPGNDVEPCVASMEACARIHTE